MGQVYRATDTNLGRQVAIKVLPEAFAQDAERVARFEREAKTLALLNHPNIAHIYGLERSGLTALVLELVEGPTLAHRIAKGPIPLEEAFPIAKQIADALETAHEQGIVHRDLKPANINVRPDGTVKVLDFGLAKALGSASPAVTSQSPTVANPEMTEVGIVLGTVAYMSPEQTRGSSVDKRTDIWAFGCVLFEMLTGKRAFEGDHASEVVSAVLRGQLDWRMLPANAPPSIRRLLRRCLERDRSRRLADIADARLEIDDAWAEPATAASLVVDKMRRTRWLAIVGSILSTAAGVALTVLILRARSPEDVSTARSVTRLELNLPTGVELYAGHAQAAALSPDGTNVAFVGVLDGVRQILLRRLDRVEATPLLRRTETPMGCFFSPDGRQLAFVTASSAALKKVSLEDRLVVSLASDVDFTSGGVWGSDDRITFARVDGLWQIPATGGAATQLTRLDKAKGELSHQWPTLVADGKVLLFTVVTGSSRDAAHIEALTLATGHRQVLVDPGTFPLYAASGHLIFFRNDRLLAVPFDANRLVVTGSPTQILESLAIDATGAPVVAISKSGALVHAPGGLVMSKLVWVTHQGLEQPLTSIARRYETPRVARDGRRVAVAADGDVWIHDAARATFTRLTSDETAGNSYPVWTPDGKRVIFRTRTGLYWIAADGSDRSQAIPGTSFSDYPNSVSLDGTTLAFVRVNTDTSGDLYVLSLQGEPRPRAVLKGPAYEGGPQLSPDGRWLAYASDESGEFQIYLRQFEGPDRRWQVSAQGGRQPLWNQNGKELFYRSGNKMMAVEMSTRPEPLLSTPRLLFEHRYAFGRSITTPSYDVSPDGQRFVMVRDESGSGRLNVVLNWVDELTRLVPR